jgi:hypothetical protein
MNTIQKIAIKQISLENIIYLLLNFVIPQTTIEDLLDRFDNDTSFISKEYFNNLYLQIKQTNKSKLRDPILERMIEIMESNEIYVDLE